MKKRLVLSLLSILLVSLLFSPDTFSQETPATVVRVAPHPLSTDNDSPLKVDIVIENGQAVTGYQVMLQYDSDYIQYVGIDHGNYLPDGAFFGDAQIRDTDPNDSLKAILFAAGTFPNQSEGDGVLATLTFKTIRDEPSDLTLLDVTRLSHGVVDDKVVLSSPQLKNSSTHVAILHSRTGSSGGNRVCDFVSLNLNNNARALAYSPDGTVLASGINRNDVYFFNEVYFFDTSTGKPLQSYLDVKSKVYGIAFSPKGRWLAIGTNAGNLYVWDRGSSPSKTWREWLKDKNNNPLQLPAVAIKVPYSSVLRTNNDINSITFSHDETRLAIGTERKDVFVSEYTLHNGWENWNDNTKLVGHNGLVRSVAFHPTNKNILASGSDDDTVRIWNLQKYPNVPPQVIKGESNVYSIAFSSNGKHLAIAGKFKNGDKDSRICLLPMSYNNATNTATAGKCRYLDTSDKHDTDVLSVAFAQSDTVLLSGDKKGKIHAWDVDSLAHLSVINDYGSSNLFSIAFNSQGNAGAVGMYLDEEYQVHQFTFDVSKQALTQANVPINDRPKVHVIWYSATNETRRSTSPTSRNDPDYIAYDNVKQNLKDVQDFFLRELDTTFEFALDANGGIKVEAIRSNNFVANANANSLANLQKNHFTDNNGSAADFFRNVWSDITNNHSKFVSSYHSSNDIYLVLVQSDHGYLGGGNNQVRSRGRVNDIGGRIAMVPLGPFIKDWSNEAIKITIAHELGHNFGLWHDFREKGRIMSYNWETAGWSIRIDLFDDVLTGKHDRLDTNWLSERSKNWLKVHPAFKKCTSPPAADNQINIEVRDASQTAQTPKPLSFSDYATLIGTEIINLGLGIIIPSITVSPNSNNEYKIHLDIEDLDGLHHIELIAPPLGSYKGCTTTCTNSVAKWWNSNTVRTRESIEFDVTELMKNYSSEGFYTKIATIDAGGNILYFDLQIVQGASGNAPLAQKLLPKETALLVNYPNPFNPETWIPYQLAKPADVALTIYDIQGHIVRDLDLGHQHAGTYHSRARAAYWDGRNAVGEPVASGVYFYTLTAGEFAATRKMLIRK